MDFQNNQSNVVLILCYNSSQSFFLELEFQHDENEEFALIISLKKSNIKAMAYNDSKQPRAVQRRLVVVVFVYAQDGHELMSGNPPG
jgi:hypothetical protein